MKEYKVVLPFLGLRKRVHKLEDFLNNYAHEGWVVNQMAAAEGGNLVIFKQDKNR